MQHLVPLARTGGEKEQTVFAPIPLMTGTTLSHNSGIPTSVDNPVSCAQADDNDNMSSEASTQP